MTRTISKSSKPVEQAPAETLELRYMPVRDAVLYENNAKKHDIGAIAESIQRHGFRNPPIFDWSLNNKNGGIVAGNGRTEALRMMELQGAAVPRGIAVDAEGRWCIPIVFGCDADSEHAAIAYCIDDNNLTLAGGEYSPADMARMWNMEGYMATLIDLSDHKILPVTVDAEAIGSLMASLNPLNSDGNDGDSGSSSGDKTLCCPSCGHEWKPERKGRGR